jgi:hypothetical protein
MTIVIYLFIIILNLIFAFRKNSSKVVAILSLLAIILFIGGAGPQYNTFNHSRDYVNYEIVYGQIENVNITDSIQVGYTILMKIGNLISLDFFTFRLIVMVICVILLYKLVIKRYSYNSNLIILMYMLYPMIIDSEHFRNFIAMTIFLISIKFLEEKSFVGNIKFLFIILLASSFHTAFLLYAFLVFAHTRDRNRLAKLIAFFTITLSAVAIFNNNQIPLLNLIINFVDDDKINRYLNLRTNLGFLIPMSLHFSSIVLLYWAKKILNRKKLRNELAENSISNLQGNELINEIKFANLVFWLNIIGIAYFPFFIISIQFYRLVRNFLLLNFIVYSYALRSLKSGTVYKLIYNLSIVLSIILWIVLDLVIKTSPDRVLIPFFTQNFFFN